MVDHRLVPPTGSTLIDRVVEVGRERRPEDDLLIRILPSYYGDLPDFDVDERRPADLYAVALRHVELARVRPAGKTIVAVVSPDADRDGWYSDRSAVLIASDDAPFLVDSARIVLERHGIATHLLVHPLLQVRRGAAGILEGVEDEPGFGVTTEAWTQIEIDRLDASAALSLRTDLAQALAGVHRVVADFPEMRQRMRDLADVDPVLPWLADGNFVFLGAEACRRPDGAADGHHVGTRCDSTGAGLGQLAGEFELDDPPIMWDGPLVTFDRSERSSSIHRPSRLTTVTVLEGDRDARVAHRFIGLLASTVYRGSVLAIPTIGDRARGVLGLATEGAEGHTGRTMRNVLETLPRDLVFELDSDQLATLVIDVVALQERQIVRVFEVPEPSGTASTILVYFPKHRFTAELPDRIVDRVAAEYGAEVRDVETFIGGSSLARVTFTVRRVAGVTPDLDRLSHAVDVATTAWIDRVHDVARQRVGEAKAAALVSRFARSIPDTYRSDVQPATAVGDLERLADLADSDLSTITALVRDLSDPDGDVWRMRVYHQGSPITLSDLLPMLGHLGLRALDEHPHRFTIDGAHTFVYDIGVRLPHGVELDDSRHREIRRAFEGLLSGAVEPDGFNRLIVLAGMTIGQVEVLRAYAKYAHQIGFTFSQPYIEDSLARLPVLARSLIELFEARLDPDLDVAVESREQRAGAVQAAIIGGLDAVSSLDDDRILRTFLAFILATVRTSAFAETETLAFKFDPAAIPELPEPRPAHEIFVCSARVEGVHLRGGAIARGGLRWSDRPEDYRTEVLGLVKAQMVKNAVIVPVGAKGGFVVKQHGATPAEHREEVVACYRLFVSSLLDLTDNLVNGELVPPDRTVRYDGADPYLVVAADKGTATFSDIANGIAAEYGFWLGDAFASGGSDGYDHKAMGITARGAWESVRRHASVLGKDADHDEMTVVGIGDMSGDVFGNGLLMSRHLKLVAAFDHRHVFIDPDPDPAASYEERRRLFELPRSSWAEYDASLITAGGGVYPRSAKSIDLTPEARSILGIDADRLPPNELISALLRADVDLLWNGGVGTYVKASTETHADVGDRANDGLRVDASSLRCKIVAEGGNLGFTQLARIEFGLNGGLIHTDAIDNSAGVDCSDHEVNIKILLGDVMADGEMTLKQRNELLAQMTGEVSDLVLANNRAQTLALLIARTQGLTMAAVHMRYLDQLESEGWIDRELEFLPSSKQLAERVTNGSGLRVPELAVMIAYTKNIDVAEILQTDLPDQPVLVEDIVGYFPTPLRERFEPQILRHRLRREIAATQIVNQMVNLSGISYDHRMTEDTGASVADVTRAWVVVREVLDFPEWWREIGALSSDRVALEDRLALYLDCRRTAERCSLWFLRHRRPPVDIDVEVARFRLPVQLLADMMAGCMSGPMAEATVALENERAANGVPLALASRSSIWRLLHTAFDIVEVAERSGTALETAATAYWDVFARLDLLWLWDGIGALPRSDRWQTQARSALRDDLLTVLAGLADNVVEQGDRSAVSWMAANERAVERATIQLGEIRRAEAYDITNLSVALRQLRNLVSTSVRGA